MSAAGRLVFACVSPHGWLLIPQISGPDGAKASSSRAALAELGRRMEAAQPETVVVVEPHGLQVEGAVALLDTLRVAGTTGGPPGEGATAHVYGLRFDVDRALNARIADEARRAGVPVRRVRNALEFIPLPLEYGTMTPLWFLGATLSKAPLVVVACVGPDVAAADCVELGRIVRVAVEASSRRVAFVASADLSHTHVAAGTSGDDPTAAACDAAIVDAVREGALDRLLALDPSLVARAKPDLAALLALHGLLDGTGGPGEVLSYEVPTYFGMLVAAFGGVEVGGSR